MPLGPPMKYDAHSRSFVLSSVGKGGTSGNGKPHAPCSSYSKLYHCCSWFQRVIVECFAPIFSVLVSCFAIASRNLALLLRSLQSAFGILNPQDQPLSGLHNHLHVSTEVTVALSTERISSPSMSNQSAGCFFSSSH